MTLATGINPFDYFAGISGGTLNGGHVYIGVAGQDPQTSPQQVYWDDAGTIPATQPLDVVGGYVMRLGTPARFYSTTSYSIRVTDRFGQQLFYVASVSPNAAFDLSNVDPVDFAGKDFLTGTETDEQSLSDRFGDWINPRAYGVVADGVTDDTAAVQATWNAIMATSKPCFWPAGRMVITSKITVNLDPVLATGVLVKGAGFGKTIFDCRGVTSYPNFEFVSTGACSYPEILDFGWWGDQPGSVLGISGTNLVTSQMNFLKLKGFVQNFNTTTASRAMVVNGLYGGEIDMICNCGTGGYVGGLGVALTVRQAQFVKFRGSYGSAFNAVYLTDGTIAGCSFDTLDMENVVQCLFCDTAGAYNNEFDTGRWAYSTQGYSFTAGTANRIKNPNIGASGGATDAMFVTGSQVGVELITNYVLPVTTPAFPATATNVVNTTGRRIIAYVRGGTISTVSVGGIVTGAISGPFHIKPYEAISFNHTGAGTWTWEPA